jgi:arsenate reductase-like glutaredoxin family protein
MVILIPESVEHKRAKETLRKFFAENYGPAINEYLDSGFEMDVFSVLLPSLKIMVETIWSTGKQNFFRDLTIVLSSDAEIKIIVANPKILEDKELVRYFERIKVTEAAKGYSMIGMLAWDSSDETSVLKTLKNEIEQILASGKEQILDEVERLKQEIFDERIPLPTVISKCLDLSKRFGLKDKTEWLRCELCGYYDYIKENTASYNQLPGKPDYREINGKTTIYLGLGNVVEQEIPLIIAQPIGEVVSWISTAAPSRELLITMPTPKLFREVFQKNKLTASPEMPVVVTVLSLSQIVDRLRVALYKFIEEIRV